MSADQRRFARRCSALLRRLSARLASRRSRRSSAAMARRSLVFIAVRASHRLGITWPRSLGLARRDALALRPCRSPARFFSYRVPKGSRVRSDARRLVEINADYTAPLLGFPMGAFDAHVEGHGPGLHVRGLCRAHGRGPTGMWTGRWRPGPRTMRPTLQLSSVPAKVMTWCSTRSGSAVPTDRKPGDHGNHSLRRPSGGTFSSVFPVICSFLASTAISRARTMGWTPTPDAPFDRVMATCMVGRVPRAWIDLTRPGGRVITPVPGNLAQLSVMPDGSAAERFHPPRPQPAEASRLSGRRTGQVRRLYGRTDFRATG